MRKFNKRVLIEVGDIVAISTRDFQSNKVDIVHKYNLEQTQMLINSKARWEIHSHHSIRHYRLPLDARKTQSVAHAERYEEDSSTVA